MKDGMFRELKQDAEEKKKHLTHEWQEVGRAFQLAPTQIPGDKGTYLHAKNLGRSRGESYYCQEERNNGE